MHRLWLCCCALVLQRARALLAPAARHQLRRLELRADAKTAEGDEVAATAAWAAWIADVNLCPFARRSLETDGAATYAVTAATTEGAFREAVLEGARGVAAGAADADPAARIAFVVAPAFAPLDFPAFYDAIVDIEDEALVEAGLADVVRVAGFHPEWTFGGVDEGDALHFEKRAPYPTASVVLAAGLLSADSGRIGDENAATLERLGAPRVADAFRRFRREGGGPGGLVK